jgi:thiamine-monophosphate kinase
MVTVRRSLADVSEEALLEQIFPFFVPQPGTIVGPGDDAAVLAAGPSVVATTDSMVRGRDWLDEWSTPADVATKVLTQNLADIAAMGAVATSVLVSLVADPATPEAWAVEFARAFAEAAADARVAVAGGDLSSAPAGTVMVSVTALGDLRGRRAVLRSGAEPGEAIAVCGTLGRSEAGYRLLKGGADAAEPGPGTLHECLAHHLRPTAPLHAGPQAADAGATAMLDISDSLLRDATRIAKASGVRMALSRAALHEDVAAVGEVLGEQALDCVLTGGEEHSLLATFRGTVPDGWRTIGVVEAGVGVTLEGVPQAARGWDHFAQVQQLP